VRRRSLRPLTMKMRTKRLALHSVGDLIHETTKKPIGCATDRFFNWFHFVGYLAGLGSLVALGAGGGLGS
jgi:hypothetical protein